MAKTAPPCRICKQLRRSSDEDVVIKLSTDLFDDITSKNQRRKLEQSTYFYKCMNAMLNNGTGIAIIHTESPHLFGKFNEIVDNRLSELISDDTCYADNFEVTFHDDYHFIIRVKPIDKRPCSVFSFNTKLAVNKGLTDPTHHQFRQLCHRCAIVTSSSQDTASSSGAQESQRRNRGLDTTKEEARVQDKILIQNTQHVNEFPFHEAAGVEAKSLVKLHIAPNLSTEEKVDAIFSYIWDDLGLPRYLTAFSKLETGGSVFYGIRQDKRIGESKKWRLIKGEDAKNVLKVHDASYAVWESRQAKSVYLVAAELKFKQETHPEEETGTFSYEQILSLSEKEQKLLSEKLCKAAKELLLWYPQFPEKNPVRVDFHRITQRQPFYYVAEVAVEQFPGFVFLDETGPEIYLLRNDQPERLEENVEVLLQKIQEQR